ncbi:hypothetical protein DYL59_07955 [Pseudomonas kairouanensis]|uniref:Uncharacterized protein n=1 Tax=Pseudomonas kairouanensis TaxID=2293832 RepID=A0A4Z0AYA8_9PSED|nr:hypothetical protein [Pseudomonas kairouanensis]TFY90908.1 hypothetical protein DYL59_07955 [Pseudomonas kairouanensis]
MDTVIRTFTMTLLMAGFLSTHVAAQERTLQLELNQGLAQLKQNADNDAAIRTQLDTLAREVPEINQTLRGLSKKSQQERDDQARFGLYRQFFVDINALSPAQAQRSLQNLLANPLVKSAEARVLDDKPAVPPGIPVTFKRNAVTARPLYLLGPTPTAGYRLGGINSDAVKDLPGARGEYARVIIASESYWDTTHKNLPAKPFHPIRPPERLACSLYWAVGNDGTQAAGIIADKELGVVPAAQLTATPSSWRGSIYFNDIANVNLRKGDVVVIDAQTMENGPYFYPGSVCPGGTVCTLPLPLAVSDAYVNSSYLRNIEYLTQEKGVHVVINAGGGTKRLDEAWSAQYPERYMPINLDNPDLQGNFDQARNDDGSIVVGSVNPVTGTAEGANYGKRINLSTWATKIQTASYQAGVKDLYTRYDAENPLAYKFSAWIVAGAVAQIQSIAFAKGLGPVPPKVMRQLLVETGHDFAHATPGVNRGRQPDVKAAVDRMIKDYANGFPPEPTGPTIKRIEGPGFAAGDRGASFGGLRSNHTATYTPVLSAAARDVTFDWKVAEPLIIHSVNPVTGELKVDVPAREGAYWHQPPPPRTSVTLTTHDSNGVTDTLSRGSSIVGVYTTDKAYSATWNVPDRIQSGQTASFILVPRRYGDTGYQVRWLAPGLFPGIQERTNVNMPDTITVTAPIVTKDEYIKVEVGGTAQVPYPPDRTITGFYLSKSVLIQATPAPAQPLTGTLTAPSSVVGGKEVSFSTDVRDVNGGGLHYVWTLLPSGFTGPLDRPGFSGFAPAVNQDTTGQVQVLVSDTKGQQLRLSQPLTVTANLPSVSILGPDTIGANQTVTLTAQVTNPPAGTLRYSWRVAAGVSATPSNSATLVITAPNVQQATTVVVSVNAGVGMNQATASKTLTITPP